MDNQDLFKALLPAAPKKAAQLFPLNEGSPLSGIRCRHITRRTAAQYQS
jgi:hypothetical protein